jgi:hypothetical protein
MDDAFLSALKLLAEDGARLREVLHFNWSGQLQETCAALLLRTLHPSFPAIHAVIGGASSGKSTIFNNLLGGSVVSTITARGHATRGLIAAVHQRDAHAVETLLDQGVLFPGRVRTRIEAGTPSAGEPGAVAVFHHDVDALEGVVLMDTPDFTSQASAREGDVLLTAAPWFDGVVLVMDRERWFDRQSTAQLRTVSSAQDHRRLVIFNCTFEEELTEADRQRLKAQCERLDAERVEVLEFRRGRGLCVFAPGTLDGVLEYLALPSPDRRPTLRRRVLEQVGVVLGQQDERAARLDMLARRLGELSQRLVPGERECLSGLMSARERRQTEIVWRVLRVRATSEWLAAQTQHFGELLRRIPGAGWVMHEPPAESAEHDERAGRRSLAKAFVERCGRRLAAELSRAAQDSPFWDEVRRWTLLEAPPCTFSTSPEREERIVREADAFDEAIRAWNDRVESECRGLRPKVRGAVGAGLLAAGVVLVAVPGPLAALTLASAHGALAAALGKLAAAAGAGAVLGRPAGRLAEVLRERLIGSAEFERVRGAALTFREHLAELSRELTGQVMGDAGRFVLRPDDPLLRSLEAVNDLGEGE